VFNDNIIPCINEWWHDTGHLNTDQRDFLVGLVSEQKPRYCIETGFCTGRSAITVLVAAEPEVLVSVEVSFNYIEGSREWADILMRAFPALHIINGNSIDVLTDEFFTKWFPNGIDFGFVDGGHSYTECYNDILFVLSHLRPNGMIVVDDYMSGPPNGVEIESVDIAVKDIIDFYTYLSIERWYKDGKGMAVLRK
jgi:predicted O-methyltransferase YrrM